MAPDTFSLAGKIAIVTGSGRENGIGAAIAHTLARNGARVVINHVSDSSAPRAAKVAAGIQSIGADVIIVQADVSTPEGAAKLANETLKGFNTDSIDILGTTTPSIDKVLERSGVMGVEADPVQSEQRRRRHRSGRVHL
jgi:NAD(P)-dependent dehydrogenase (short-subunit alcohol dehydrogenase family)